MKVQRSGRVMAAFLGIMISAAASHAAAADVSWLAMRGETIPTSAFSAAAKDHDPVRICRVSHRREAQIGMIRDFYCQIGGDGMSRPYSIYDVLIAAPGTSWVSVKDGVLPDNAVALNEEMGPDIFACRLTYEGTVLVGMVRDGRCSASFLFSELRSDDFEVLAAE